MNTTEMFNYAILGCFVIIGVYLYFSVDKIDENDEVLPEASPVHRREFELTKRIKRRMTQGNTIDK
tara:strand:+ start:116 stop:313 length:198 start_codon:yes stop_codon:yes gene_type:complete